MQQDHNIWHLASLRKSWNLILDIWTFWKPGFDIFKHILKKVKYPPPSSGPGPWAGPGLGPWGGGVGYLGVFHLFQNVFENVKSGFSKCPNVQNQVSGFPKGCKMPGNIGDTPLTTIKHGRNIATLSPPHTNTGIKHFALRLRSCPAGKSPFWEVWFVPVAGRLRAVQSTCFCVVWIAYV